MPFWQFYFLESFYTDLKNLVSFKKFPCRDGLGSTETATSCNATQVIPFEKSG